MKWLRERFEELRASWPEKLSVDDVVAFERALWMLSHEPPELQPEPIEYREWWRLAAALSEAKGRSTFATLDHQQIAFLSSQMGDLETLAATHRRLCEQCNSANEVSPDRCVGIMLDLAESEIQLGEWQQALDLTHTALAVAQRAADVKNLLRCYQMFSSLHRELGTSDQARIFQVEQSRAAATLGDPVAILDAEIEGLRVDLAGPNARAALDKLPRLLEHDGVRTNESKLRDLQFLSLLARGRSLDPANLEENRALAQDFLSFAVDPRESRVRSWRSLWWVVALANRRADKDALRQAIDLAEVSFDGRQQKGDAGQLRALLLGRLLGFVPVDAKILAAVEAQYALLIEDWKRRPNLESGAGLLRYSGRRQVVVDVMTAAMLALPGGPGKERALSHWLRTQVLGSLSPRTELGSAITLEQIRTKILRPDEGLLAFLPGETTTLVIAIDREGLTIGQGAGEWAMMPAREAFEAMIGTRPNRTTLGVDELDRKLARREMERLGRELLPVEVMERVRAWHRIAVVGSDLLITPFVEAWIGPKAREPLGITHAIRHLPSVAAGNWLAARNLEHGRGPGYAVVAGPIPDPELARTFRVTSTLPFPDGLATRFRGAAKGNPIRLAIGAEASDRMLFSLDASEVGVACIIAHGIRDSARLRPAGILLAPGRGRGSVFATDLESWRCPNTVLLATCGGTSGPGRLGDEGIQHLGGALFRAGACSVAGSSLELDYEATLALLEVTLAELARGAALPDALQRARRVIRENPRFDHPSLYLTLQAFGL